MTLAIRDPSIPDSPLSRWDTRWKLAAMLAFAFLSVTLLAPIPAALSLLAAVLLNALGRVAWSVIVGRAMLLAAGVLLFVVVLPFTHEAGFWAGLRVGGVVAMRVMTVGLLALVLMRSNPFHELLAAAHALKLPGVLVQVAQLAYRYTFVLASEARRLRIALRARAFRLQSNVHTYRTLGHTIGSLLVRGSDHSERVSEAMRCRGFDGGYHTLLEFRTRFSDVVAFIAVVLLGIGLMLVDRLWLGAA
jgi:cobalt/nickel transport system permease protein